MKLLCIHGKRKKYKMNETDVFQDKKEQFREKKNIFLFLINVCLTINNLQYPFQRSDRNALRMKSSIGGASKLIQRPND